MSIGGGTPDGIEAGFGVHGAFTASRQPVSMAKLRSPFFSSWISRRAEGTDMAMKSTTRPIHGDGHVIVKLPGAGAVRLDLKKHIDASLKSASNALNDRYKFSGRNGGKRDR